MDEPVSRKTNYCKEMLGGATIHGKAAPANLSFEMYHLFSRQPLFLDSLGQGLASFTSSIGHQGCSQKVHKDRACSEFFRKVKQQLKA